MSQIRKSFKSLNDELEKIVDQLQDPGIDIDEALKLYRKGQDVIVKIQRYLREAKNTVKSIKTSSNSQK